MSKIEKLSVQGIRSFGTGSGRETMQFFTPLTLIVGYNGSGKTTIIECLKYATTGEQPPNSKGGAFVHDPKLVGEKEVLAQVKLAFTSTTGVKHVVTRSLQLTIKKTTRSLKTLEGSLATNNNGERSVLSTRVAQMDEAVPALLGVSTAILDYVIFCHQDESLWPMSEPGALKKQFDQIFEAMRYTKAIDNLKVLRKKQGEELARLKIHESQDKINKEKGDRAEKRSMELQAEIEGSREACNGMNDEMAELSAQIKQKRLEANKFLNIVNDLKYKKEQFKFRQSAISDLQTTLEELEEDDETLQTNLSQYEERMARFQTEERQNRSQYTQLQNDLGRSRNDLSARLSDKGKHESDKDKYERQLASRVDLIHEAAELHGFRGFDGDLKDTQIKSFNDRIQKLLGDKKRDLERVQKENAQELTSWNTGKKELIARKRKLETLTSTWKEKLDAQIGSEWQAETIEPQFQSVLKKQSQLVAQTRQKRDMAREKQQKIDFSLKSARDAQQKKSDEISRCHDKVLDVLKQIRDEATIDDYAEEVKLLEEDVEAYSTDISLLEALSDYYKQCQETLTKKNKCKLCDRGFDDKQSVNKSRFSDKLIKYLDPSKKEKASEDLDKSKATLDKLRQVRVHHETYERSLGELPGLKEACKTLEAELETHERQLEEHDENVNAEEAKQADVETLNKTVMNISQTLKDMKDSEAQVERIMSQQSSGMATRTADEIHELQATCKEQMRSTKARLTKITTDRQRMRDQLNSLELEKSELKNKLSRVQSQLERKKDFQNQIQTLKEDQANQRELIQKADQDLEVIEPSIAEARAVRDDTLQRGRAKEKAIVEERDLVANSVTELKMVESDIQDYMDRGGPSNLAANQRAIDGLEKTIAATEQEISDLTVRTNKLKQDIDNGDRKKQNISNNLKFRQNKRQLDVLRAEIDDLQSCDADDDYDRLNDEAVQLENRHNMLVAERGSLMGQMKTKDEELARLLGEWEMDYRDASKKYRESHIKVETTKAAIEDLGRYGAALDKAIMQYHGLKMEEVNRIAGELWQSTYQGTDIDTILIRSDNEGATGRRSYNYRVCMVKQDTEMDMRGRCSAGQKVLASIIIRLALAESFGVNCGLIALDEPTTNLDKDNIKSLAESLHHIIKSRQAQSNFQLIVITHDEEFLRHMRCSEFCDSFFRVKRDDKQCSVISRESITRVL
ncbi:DNA repair protein RAD50 [Verticillium alfalfae VaMs.102]|uniref:DNA repair protein RAD50 n=1 Tax=Verticillium alfalfae (strain VaMs.102 / ATCC MYA-4576 / FGSC 10136) TaxID=526221 RepID=C9SQJ2_VERA1|nr:DNA repair protein RAD50 [Verticillium alfalfae VaMs.102]EEY21117.1 DNA repair protein RAD50 [Verticillium alfalfae VaMs.102]